LGSRFTAKSRKQDGVRTATAPKQGGMALPVILTTVMVFYAGFAAWNAVRNVRMQLGVPDGTVSARILHAERIEPDEVPDAEGSDAEDVRHARRDRLAMSFRALEDPPGA